MQKKLSKAVWERRVNEAGAGRYEFIRWTVDGEFGALKKCVVRCVKDGYEWSVKPNNLVDGGRGCPQCAGQRMWTSEERVKQINKLDNIKFVSWVGDYKGSKSKANVICLVDNFEWRAAVNDIVNKGCGCPQCARVRRWSAEDRIKQINDIDNIEFVSWLDGYKNAFSKANVRCLKDGFVRPVNVNDLVNKGFGCPQCAGKRRWTANDRIEQINSLENIEFISWVDGHNGKDSKASVRCEIDGFEWSTAVHGLVNHGTGCPKCSKSGYDPSKSGFLYALRSECGLYLKVGISNNPSQRHRTLKLETPFSFSCIEQFEDDGTKIAELEKYFHNKYERAGFVGFDGCTEWLICTPELLEELRKLGDRHGI